MNSSSDYYQTLGVLPDAESVVITAAYRALASLYHPDRWKGDKGFANNKMAEINVAYATLSDPEKRAKYNQSHKQSHNSYEDDDSQTDEAFDSALSELEIRWQVATEIFPDLQNIRNRLSKTSHRLAFAFVTMILETKKFDSRIVIANSLEKKFLELHFGTNSDIIFFARALINSGQKKAIVALNKYVDVLGSSIDPQLVIGKISRDFNFNYLKAKQDLTPSVLALRETVKKYDYLGDALDLILASGFEYKETGTSLFFSNTKYEVTQKNQHSGEYISVVADLSIAELIAWVKANLC